jgi:hypothetical protein
MNAVASGDCPIAFGLRLLRLKPSTSAQPPGFCGCHPKQNCAAGQLIQPFRNQTQAEVPEDGGTDRKRSQGPKETHKCNGLHPPIRVRADMELTSVLDAQGTCCDIIGQSRVFSSVTTWPWPLCLCTKGCRHKFGRGLGLMMPRSH